jgi:hypothetical protein
MSTERPTDPQPADEPQGFTCPRCTHTSHHPLDRRYGYCGRCHEYTGTPEGDTSV